MKKIKLSIRDFAIPIPRIGSIEAHSGYGKAALEGLEIHLAIQSERLQEDSSYESEVEITADFEREGFQFEVCGRMDGFFNGEPPRIEEIKTTFNTWDLQRKLAENPYHPYCLQLKTYGYFYFLKNGVIPELNFHLVSTRNHEAKDFDIELNRTSYEKWLNRRLDELVEEAKLAEKRAARRRKIALDFPFPYDNPRPGQIELIQTVEEGMAEGKRMLIQAPTGLGKTAGVLYPTLKEALSRGQKVVYVTPKNSQHAVAEDAVTRFQESGSKIKSLTVTAKSKICFKNEPLCNPEYCEYARDHYTKVYENDVLHSLGKKKKLRAKTFRELGEKYQVCPFELQLDAATEADVVICDYNYVFAPRISFGRLSESTTGQEGKPNLVIDEAHNLLARAIEYYSPSISTFVLEKMLDEVLGLPAPFDKKAEELIGECRNVILDCKPEKLERGAKIQPKLGMFMEMDSRLKLCLSKYLESDAEILPKDVMLRLSFYWSEFAATLEYLSQEKRDEFFITFQPHPTGGAIKITCCDPSQMLESCYDDYQQIVGFSATLKPFSYYAELCGLDKVDNLKTAEFTSPFATTNRKLLIIPQISTKYSERARNYPKIAETIRRVAALKKGNYFAFFPSFDFLYKTLEEFNALEGFTILRQERDMRGPQIEAILEHLRDGNEPTIVFAVQGGVFSEGVDYPGQMIIGAFVVGPPLPSFDLEREEMRKYYDTHHGSGFDYAYTFPAMAKAVQAAGRVIRSETDRGLIVLMDNRFIHENYSQSMPGDWFQENPRELVSNSILKEVSEFWEGSEEKP